MRAISRHEDILKQDLLDLKIGLVIACARMKRVCWFFRS